MKKQEILEELAQGKIVAIGEYRSGKPESFQYRDKKTGQAATFQKVSHHIELGADPVTVVERVPDGVKLESVKIPFTKGQQVCIVVASMTVERGVITMQGQIHVLDKS